MTKDSDINYTSAEEYKVDGGYLFPFKALDDTPGGGNLGTIEWCVEILKSKKSAGRRYITELLVWAQQTRDKRYDEGKTFRIPMYTEAICSSPKYANGVDFLKHTWNIEVCVVHKAPILRAYPDPCHNGLLIECGSSISNGIRFMSDKQGD